MLEDKAKDLHHAAPSSLEPLIDPATRRLFEEVVIAYDICHELLAASGGSPIGQGSTDMRSPSDYIARVERATDYALQGSALLDEWFCVNEGVQFRPEIDDVLIALCGPIYRDADLTPRSYFTGKNNVTDELLQQPWEVRVCETHDLQPVRDAFRDAKGYAMELECGCLSRATGEYEAAMADLIEAGCNWLQKAQQTQKSLKGNRR